ncbi:MAG: HAD hydrolase-like protein [Burkholderiales bacterium]|nr:HAD hydrolase-like protein [Burkholderiales bacterium]
MSTLLLDLDGTLTDNCPGITRSIAYALTRLGAPVPGEDVLRRCIGPPIRESFAWLLDDGDPAAVEAALALYRERYGDVGWRENVVYDGVPQMLDQLAATGRRMVLCTSKPEVYARRIVTLFGLSPPIAQVYGADLGNALDDKAKLLAHAAAREGFDPGDALMIGDRSHDVRAARMNGARSIGVLWGYGTAEELAGADARVAAPAELPEAVATLAARGRG